MASYNTRTNGAVVEIMKHTTTNLEKKNWQYCSLTCVGIPGLRDRFILETLPI